MLTTAAHLSIDGVPFAISQKKSGGKEYAYGCVSTLKLHDALKKK
jgi:hypothetical protein